MMDGFDKLRDKALRGDAIRDAYGFEVKRELEPLHKKFSPLWQEEECERARLWSQFWLQLCEEEEQGGDCTGADTHILQRILSQYDTSTSSQPNPDTAARLQQLRALVQAGVPMASRGKYWQLFLSTSKRRVPELYSELVSSALEHHPALAASAATQEAQFDSSSGGAQATTTKPAYQAAKQPGLEGVGSLGLPVVEIQADCSNTTSSSIAVPAAAEVLVEDGMAAAVPVGHTTFTVTSHEIQPLGEARAGEVSAEGGLLLSAAEPAPDVGAGTDQSPARQHQAVAGAAAEEAVEDGGGLATPAPLLPSAVAECASAGSSSSGGYTSRGCLSTGAWKAKDWVGQIEKDLHRTFPGHPLMDASGREVLRRILAAYARHNPAVGYCQGMNFIAACFMLFMEEEDAFWCLAAVVEDLLKGYFDTKMVAPQVDQQVFAHLVQGGFPTVWAHLQALEVDVASVTMQWFLCMFLNSLPLETCLRVWDVLFFEGSPVVLFRVALALLEVYQQALLECRECSDAYMLLQSMGPMSFDSSRLLDTACIGYGHIRDSALRVLRGKYRPPILEHFRGSFSSDEEFEEYAYLSAAEPPYSRSQSFADAIARVMGAKGGGASGDAPAIDQGHLTPASNGSPAGGEAGAGGTAEGRRSCDGGEGSRAARSTSPLVRLLPQAAQQAMSAITARLVRSSLPAPLPSGALDARGEEVAPTAAATPAERASFAAGVHVWLGRDSRRGSRAGDVQPTALASTPEGEAVGDGELLRISTQRAGMAGSSESPSCRDSHSAASGAALLRGGGHGNALTPFTDPVLAGSRGSISPRDAGLLPQLQALQQGASDDSGTVHPAVAGPLDPVLDFRSPLKPCRVSPPSCPASGQGRPAGRHRRAHSALPTGGYSPSRHQSRHRRRSFLPDLYRLAAFVPDFRQPAVAAAYQIAANPSPRQPLHHSPQKQPGAPASPTLLYSRTPLSSVLGVAGSSGGSRARRLTGSPEQRQEETAAEAEEGSGPVRVLRFEPREGEEGGATPMCCSTDEHCSAPAAPLAATPFTGGTMQLLPPRRYTEGDAGLGASEPWHSAETLECCGIAVSGSSPDTNGPAGLPVPGQGASPSLSPPACHSLPPEAPDTCSQQLAAVVERLQEEVATAESRRHVAELAARAAADTGSQLRRQLDKLRREVAEKVRLVAALGAKVAGVGGEVEEMEGELCAGRMASQELQCQVEQRRQQLAGKDDLIRALMDRASRG